MGYTGNTKAFIVAQDAEPTSPFDGQIWKDTSTNTTKQYDAASDSWESIQSSGDGVSVGKNPSGEFKVLPSGIVDNDTTKAENGSVKVKKPAELVIGTFESNWGDWTATGNFTRDTEAAHTGSYGANNDEYSGDLYRNVDLTDYDVLKLWYLFPSNEQYYAEFWVSVGGTEKFRTDREQNNRNQWYLIEIDVSGESGSTEIRVTCDSSEFGGTIFDDFSLTAKNKTFNGAGGQ